MVRKLSPEHRLELERHGRELSAVVGVLFPPDDLGFQAVIDGAVRDGNLRGIRMMVGDVLEMLQVATPEQRLAIDAELRARNCRSLAEIDTRSLARLERLLTRGSLRGEEQYFFARGQLELIQDAPERRKETARLRELLAEYEGRIAARSPKRNRSAAR